MKRELKDHDPELESDELWDLLDQSPRQTPSADFSNRVLEQIKTEPAQPITETAANVLTPSSQQASWWQSRSSKKVIISLATAAACLFIGLNLFPNSELHSSKTQLSSHEFGDASEQLVTSNVPDDLAPAAHSAAHAEVPRENLEDSVIDDPFNDVLETEILLAIANDPSLYANEEISAILGF